MLARASSLPEAALSAIRSDPLVRRVVIVGGKSAVSDAVASALGGSYECVRLGGADRYETSALVAAWCRSHGLQAGEVGLATGQNFPDALSASALLGRRGAPLLLAAIGHASNAAKAAQGASKITVLGGTGAVPASVADEVAGGKGTKSLSYSLKYGRELVSKASQYVLTTVPGAVEIPRTLAAYRAKYGTVNTSDLSYGGKYAIMSKPLPIPGTGLRVEYESYEPQPSNDEARAYARQVEGTLGELVSGFDVAARVSIRDFVAKLKAPFAITKATNGYEVCGSCLLSYTQGKDQAFILMAFENDPGEMTLFGSAVVGMYVDVEPDGTVSSQSSAKFMTMTWS